MKNILLFIKNNRIIGKISIVLMVILMLICVVCITPKKVNRVVANETVYDSNIGIDLGAREIYFNDEGYTKLVFAEADETEGTPERSIEYSYSEEDGHVITLENVDFTTKANIALGIWEDNDEEDVTIVLVGENKITSIYSAKEKEFYGIANWSGDIVIEGEGSLKVTSSNWENTDAKYCTAIYAADDFIMHSGTVYAKANGRKGIGVYTEDSFVLTGGELDICGGTSGEAGGIFAVNNVNIEGGALAVEVSSDDDWICGIQTDNDYEEGVINITGGKVNIKVSGDGEDMTLDQIKQIIECDDDVACDEDKGIVIDYIDNLVDTGTISNTKELVTHVLSISGDESKKNIVDCIRNVFDYCAEGIGLYSNKIVVDNAALNIELDGMHRKGIYAYVNPENYYEGLSSGIYIRNNAKVDITGDVCTSRIPESWCGSKAITTGGTSVEIENAKVNINLKNTRNNTSVEAITSYINNDNDEYGDEDISALGNIIIKEGSSIKINNTAGVGLEVENKIDIQGGHLLMNCSERAINDGNLEFYTPDEDEVDVPKTGVISAATDYEGKNRTVYVEEDVWAYKYMEFGEIYDFPILINENGIYKATDNDYTIGEEAIPSELISKLGIEHDYNNNEDKTIVTFNNTIFNTTSSVGITITADNTSLVLNGDNYLSACVNRERQVLGLMWGSATISGSGTLNISTDATITSDTINNLAKKGICARENLTINSGNINVYVKGTDTFGIIGDKKVYINGGNYNIVCNETAYSNGLWGREALEINGGNIDVNMLSAGNWVDAVGSGKKSINEDTREVIPGQYDYNGYVKVTGGYMHIKAELKTGGSAVNIYNGDYLQTGGVIDIDMSSSNGVNDFMFGLDGINETIQDGTFEVSVTGSQNYGMVHNNAGTFTINSDLLDISYVNDSNGNNVTSTVKAVNNYINTAPLENKKYTYMRIEPTYYYMYQKGNIYRNTDVSTPASVPGLSVVDGKLIMDGFNFTTSAQYGIYSEEEMSIKVVEGSINRLDVNSQVAPGEISSNIKSEGNLSISGKGRVCLNNNATVIGNAENYSSEAVSSKKNVTIEEVSLEIYGQAIYNYGILSNETTSISNSDISFRFSDMSYVAMGIYGQSDITLDKTNVYIKSDAQMIVYGVRSHAGSIYAKNSKLKMAGVAGYGMSLNMGTDDVVKLEEMELDLILDAGTAISSGNPTSNISTNTVDICNSIINIKGSTECEGIAGIYTENGAVLVKESYINVNNTTLSDCYGIKAKNKIHILDSGVNVNTKSSYSMGVYSTDLGVYISNSGVNLCISGETESATTGIGSGKERVHIEHSLIDMNINMESSSEDIIGIVSGDFFNDMSGYYNNEVTEVNAEQSDIYINISNNSDSNNSYGIKAYTNTSFSNMGNINIAINGCKSGVYGIYARENEMFNNIESLSIDIDCSFSSGYYIMGLGAYGTLEINNIKNIDIDINDKGTVNTKGVFGIYSYLDGTIINVENINITNTGQNWLIGIYSRTQLEIENVDKATIVLGEDIIDEDTSEDFTAICGKNALSISNSGVFNIDIYGGYNSWGITTEENTATLELENIEDIDININEESETGISGAFGIQTNNELTIKKVKFLDIYTRAIDNSYGISGDSSISLDNTDIEDEWNIIVDVYHTGRGIVSSSVDVEAVNLDTIKVTACEGSTGYSCCIWGTNNININKSFIDAITDVPSDGEGIVVMSSDYTGSMIVSSSEIYVTTNGATTDAALGVLGNASFIKSKIDARNVANEDVEGDGIAVTGNLNIKGGKILALGGKGLEVDGTITYANKASDSSLDFDTKVIEVSKDYIDVDYYELEEVISYPGESINTAEYKYILIDEVKWYGLKYNANEKKMYKVYEDGTAEEIDSSVVPGWYVDDDNNELDLNKFTLRSFLPKAFEIVGDVQLDIQDTNRIHSLDGGQSNGLYGIYSDSKLEFEGDGYLEIVNINNNYTTSDNTYIAIYTPGELNILGGEYSILGKEKDCNGICAASIRTEVSDYKIDVEMDITGVKGNGMYTSTNDGINLVDSEIEIFMYGDKNSVGTDMNLVLKGIHSEGEVSVDGGRLCVDIDNPTYHTVGIHVEDELVINNAAYVGTYNNGAFIKQGGGAIYSDALSVGGDVYVSNSRLDTIHIDGNVKGNGMFVTGKIEANAGQIYAQGGELAIYVGDATNSKIYGQATVSNNYDGSDSQILDGATVVGMLNSYTFKYFKVNTYNDFYLTYDSTSGKMYKNNDPTQLVTNNSEEADIATYIPGWSVGTGNRLVLDGFDFITSNQYGLVLEDSTTISVAENSTNMIKSVCSEDSIYANYAISGKEEEDTDITIEGTGKLDIGVYRACKDNIEGDWCEGICTDGNVVLNNASNINISIYGGKYLRGFCVDDNFTSNNSNVKISLNSDADDSGCEGYGVKVKSGEVRITGGKFDIDVYASHWYYVSGTYSNTANTYVNNAILDVKCANINKEESYITAVEACYGNLYMDGGTLIADMKSPYSVWGAYGRYDVGIKNMTSIDIALETSKEAYAIDTGNGILVMENIVDSNITITNASYASALDGNGVSLKSSNINVTMGTKVHEASGFAIGSNKNDIVIEGGRINVIGLKSNWHEFAAINTREDEDGSDENKNNLYMTDAEFIVDGEGYEHSDIFGIYVRQDDAVITGGTCDINLSSANYAAGICVYEKLKISDTTEVYDISISDAAVGVGVDGTQGNVELSNVGDLNINMTDVEWIEAIFARKKYTGMNANIDIIGNSMLDTEWSQARGIVAEQDGIVITGGTISSNMNIENVDYCVGIYAESGGDVLITNPVSINLTQTNRGNEQDVSGIDSNAGDVIIDGGNINITSASNCCAWGIYARYSATIRNMEALTMNITAGADMAMGVDAGNDDVTISNVKDFDIIIPCGHYIEGISGDDNVKIVNSDINISACSVNEWKRLYGISAENESIDIEGGKLTVSTPNTSKGIYVAGVNGNYASVHIKDVIVDMDLYTTSTAYETSGETYISGIESYNDDVCIEGGSIDIKATSTYEAWGVYAEDDIIINNVDSVCVNLVENIGRAYGIDADYGDCIISNIKDMKITVSGGYYKTVGITGYDSLSMTNVNAQIDLNTTASYTVEMVDGLLCEEDISITGGDLDINIIEDETKGTKVKGLYVAGINADYGDLSINEADIMINIDSTYYENTNGDVTAIDVEYGSAVLDGGTIDLYVDAKQGYVAGIYAASGMELKNLRLVDIELQGIGDVRGIYSTADSCDASIYNVNSLVINSKGGIENRGICTADKIYFDRSDVDIVSIADEGGTNRALCPIDDDTPNDIEVTKSKIYAATTSDGDLSQITLDELNEGFLGYSYVQIDFEKVVSVDITWGSLDYDYKVLNWNDDSLVYDLASWQCEEGADKIIVTNKNESTEEIYANLTYDKDETYSFITGDIVSLKKTSDTPAVAFMGPKKIEPNNSLETYLVLDGILPRNVSGVTVGEVTIELTD